MLKQPLAKHTLAIILALVFGITAGVGVCSLLHRGHGSASAAAACEGDCHCKTGGWCCCNGKCKPKCDCEGACKCSSNPAIAEAIEGTKVKLLASTPDVKVYRIEGPEAVVPVLIAVTPQGNVSIR